MNERAIPSDPLAQWYDRAHAAEDKIERMLPVVNAAIGLIRASGRHNTELRMNKLKEEVGKYRP